METYQMINQINKIKISLNINNKDIAEAKKTISKHFKTKTENELKKIIVNGKKAVLDMIMESENFFFQESLESIKKSIERGEQDDDFYIQNIDKYVPIIPYDELWSAYFHLLHSVYTACFKILLLKINNYKAVKRINETKLLSNL